MPRKLLGPSKKARRKLWEEENMAKAIQAVQSKQMGLKKASKIFFVPRATLQRLARQDKPPEEAASTKLGRKPVLGEKLEKELVEYLLVMESKFYGLTRQDVRRIAFQLCLRNGIKHPFSEEGLAGRSWFDHFMNRHRKVLSVLKPAATSFSRANGFNKEAVNHFFDILEAEYAKHKYPPDRIFNVDETGISVVQSKIPRVVGLKGKRQVGALSSAERGSLVTLVCCMSAGGTFVPPFLIFPRKNMTEILMKGAPPGSIGRCHPSGWIQSNIFTDWLKHFVEKTKPSKDNPVLLILDGHNSHTKNIEVLTIARENHISIVSLPPHTSHKLQPLDKTFFGALKHHYSENIRQWMRHSNRPVGPYDIAELLGKAYLTCQTGSIAVRGFQVTGLYPCNRNVFSAVDYAASSQEVLDLETLQKGKGRRPKTSTTAVTEPTTGAEILQEDDQNASMVTFLRSKRAETASLPLSENVQLARIQPSTEDLALAGPSGLCTENKEKTTLRHSVSPKDIWPVPKPKRKVTNKGPKPSKAALITSSPYKDALVAAEEKRNRSQTAKGKRKLKDEKNKDDRQPTKKKQSKTKATVKGKRLKNSEIKPDRSVDSGQSVSEIPIGVETAGDEEAICLFCEGLFSEDNQGEMWLQCLICNMWAHYECAGCEKDAYVCDFCK